ncbi:hypothetical protein UJ101_02668 [Flavobacteriaceae bacterium UJ101]|nr:hypothetical protein UJ101_02668 [Flavobacteriaceae bacterium UJ101]
MNLPKFLLADNAALKDDIFVLHTDYPRFLINLATDEVEWFDDLEGEEEDLTVEVSSLLDQAGEFYEKEMEAYAEDENF